MKQKARLVTGFTLPYSIRPFFILTGFILLSSSAKAESLAGYYLRFVRNQGVFDTLVLLIYVVCGILSLYNLALVFQKMNEGDAHGERNARTWCLSLLMIACCTYFLSLLVRDSYSMSQINFGEHLQKTTNKVNSSYSIISKMVYLVCGIVGLMVLPGKFKAMQQGDRYAGKSITNWGLSLVAVCVCVYILHIVFFK
ncbi:DUF4134 family protein [Xanthocytophaga flava]|uniref:DUF4134 family protein n=1 Tax=Xanthocytophaga flava TaxID=3048013 RepID=UPI0028D51CDE|nr:DUF4134 family protein [Xanthocytophaga flavus]MDJ1470231.1 DUF4134 family protein [Xanthocytophaga flavus]